MMVDIVTTAPGFSLPRFFAGWLWYCCTHCTSSGRVRVRYAITRYVTPFAGSLISLTTFGMSIFGGPFVKLRGVGAANVAKRAATTPPTTEPAAAGV